MKESLFKYIMFLMLVGFVSCTDETSSFIQSDKAEELLISGEDFIEAYPESRTIVDINNKGASFRWSDNDTIGVFPEQGAQVYFIIEKNTGKTAVFTGGGWALKASSIYGAYYPFIPDFKISRNSIPVSYDGQLQKGNASTAHLGKFDYMVAMPGSPENGVVKLHFKHMGCLMHFKTQVLPSMTLEKVMIVTTDKKLPVKGVLNIDEGMIEVDEASMSSELTLICEEVTTQNDARELTINFMMPPFNLTGEKFYIKLFYDDGTQEQIEVKGDNYEAGKSYNLTSEALNHEQVIVIEHAAEKFVIPTFEGVDIYGKVYWGDYSEEDLSEGALHQYTDGKEKHSVTIGLKNANKVRFNSIENISCIDFTKM